MVIETFKPGAVDAVYDRYALKGRMLPDGLVYITSWIAEDRSQCFQIMETEDPQLFSVWMGRWQDLVDFEVIAILDSPTR